MIRLIRLCLALAWVATAFAQDSDPVLLQARLQSHLTSYLSKPGAPFRCVIIAPYEVNGEVLIPEGSILYGVVRQAKAIHLGFTRERASLALDFIRYETPDGESYKFAGHLRQIDNAREEVTQKGIIRGVLAANNPNQLINGIWRTPNVNVFARAISGMTGLGGQVLERYPLLPIGPAVRLGLRCAILPFPEPEIHLPPGTDFQIVVDRSQTMFAPQVPEPILDSPAELTSWVAAQPSTLETLRGKKVDDIINVVLLGSRQELLNAFNVAGWYVADRRSRRSFSRSFLAYNTMASYAEAPVSKLLYRGKMPDFTFERSLDTVSKRHHIRVWYSGTFDGRDVWLGAATHDTGLRFNRSTFLPTHTIDTRVDGERSKVGVDLSYAGCSRPAMYAARDLQSAGLQTISSQTDGRVAVLELEGCNAPALDADQAAQPALPGNRVTRVVRRVVLEARSYVLRENIYYWTFQATRHYWVFRHSLN